MTTEITIEQVEALAATLLAEDCATRSRLVRLIVAEARIVALREPERLTRRATHHGDEAGHWDSSYPPAQRYTERTGPCSIKCWDAVTDDVPTESGFYYSWRRVTTEYGLAVDAEGRLWRSEETGTGRVGSFAAHPGDCDVDCTIRWWVVSPSDVSVRDLRLVEAELRAIAFPGASAREAQAK